MKILLDALAIVVVFVAVAICAVCLVFFWYHMWVTFLGCNALVGCVFIPLSIALVYWSLVRIDAREKNMARRR